MNRENRKIGHRRPKVMHLGGVNIRPGVHNICANLGLCHTSGRGSFQGRNSSYSNYIGEIFHKLLKSN